MIHDSAVCGFKSSLLVAAEGDCPGLVVVAAWVKVKVMARRHRIHLHLQHELGALHRRPQTADNAAAVLLQ